MVLLYEAAAKKHPSNEEILTHLYMSYVRVDDYQQQQKVHVHMFMYLQNCTPLCYTFYTIYCIFMTSTFTSMAIL